MKELFSAILILGLYGGNEKNYLIMDKQPD